VSVLGVLLASVAGTFNAAVFAEGPASTNFRFDETNIGSGGFVQSSSTSYRADTATGDLAIGNSASTNYQVEAGSKTTHEPNLTVAIGGVTSNFTAFSPSAASTATATFSISNYTSYGYIVQVTGDTLKNGSHSIPAMASTGASDVGTEQFGMNLVANTAPASVGSNPVYDVFGVGTIAGNYATPNQFRYVSGETVAVANQSSGRTTYTITYLANVESLTPGGQYNADHTLIVTGTY
jgi:hypothetical protein